MSDSHAATGDVVNDRLDEPSADDTSQRRGALATVWSAVTAVVGGIMGLLPHLLHHVGLLGGAVLVTGATGNVLFAVLGLVFSLPLLRRLYRRFGTWKAPTLALGVFALMFSLSAFVIGPAISNDDQNPDRDRIPVQTPDPDEHEGHHD
jgi:VIT1/CCC1 family predicted Fe2+/Mn2+ transporter